MKKLRNKVYVTILFILTIFQIVFCLFFNISIYKKEKDTLDNNIKMLSSIDDDTYQNENNIFLDYNVYTVLLTDNNEMLGIISHNYNTKVDNNIVKIAKMIIRTKDIKKVNNLISLKFRIDKEISKINIDKEIKQVYTEDGTSIEIIL